MSSELFDSGHSFSDKNTREEILDQISHGESGKNNCKNLQQLFHHQNADFGGKMAKVFLKNVRIGVVNIILKIWEKSCGMLMKQPVLFSLLLLHPFPSTHPIVEPLQILPSHIPLFGAHFQICLDIFTF